LAQGWETRITKEGAVQQAGIPTPERRPSSLEGMPLGVFVEAVVLQVYFPEESTTKINGQQTCILADVRTIGQNSRELSKIRVLQPRHGRWDEDLWVPRPARVTTDGSNLVVQPTGITGSKGTPAENMDADHVIVTFLDSSIAQPVILPIQAPHPNAGTLPLKSAGQVRRIRTNGTLMEWSSKGSWTLDATGAATEALGTKATEVSASGDGGVITIRTEDGAGAQSSLAMDHIGGIKLTGAGGEYLEMTKSGSVVKISGTKHEVSATTFETSGTTATIGHSSVALATVPRQPVAKGTALNASVTASLTTIMAYLFMVATAMDVLKSLPSKAEDKAKVAAASTTNPLTQPATQQLVTVWAATAVQWQSKKVTTG